MKLYLHTFEKENPHVLDTGILNFKKEEGTLQDLMREIGDVLPVKKPKINNF